MSFCFSVSLHTYLVMGVNNPFIQATVMSKAKVHSVIPKKMEARFDIAKGYFNYQFLPVEGVKTIASARYANLCVIWNQWKYPFSFGLSLIFPFPEKVLKQLPLQETWKTLQQPRSRQLSHLSLSWARTPLHILPRSLTFWMIAW